MNSGVPLNVQELRNALHTPWAAYVRQMRKELAPLLIKMFGNKYKIAFRGDGSTTAFTLTSIPDAGSLVEFIPFDDNGKVIKNTSGQFPAPELSDIRDQLYDIRGVDVRLTLRSKELFFKKELSRIIAGLSNSDATNTDKYLRDSVIVSVNTRNLGGQSF